MKRLEVNIGPINQDYEAACLQRIREYETEVIPFVEVVLADPVQVPSGMTRAVAQALGVI